MSNNSIKKNDNAFQKLLSNSLLKNIIFRNVKIMNKKIIKSTDLKTYNWSYLKGMPDQLIRHGYFKQFETTFSLMLEGFIEFRKENGSSDVSYNTAEKKACEYILTVLCSIAYCGHLEILKKYLSLLKDNQDCLTKPMLKSIIESACKSNQLAIMKYIQKEYNIKEIPKQCFDFAVEHGYVDIVKYIIENSSQPKNEKDVKKKVEEELEDMEDDSGEDREDDIEEDDSGSKPHNLLNEFIKSMIYKHKDLVEYFSTLSITGGDSNEMVEYACQGGMPDLAKNFLQKVNKPRKSEMKKAMNAAAGSGCLELVKLFHETRKEGCTYDAMDSAATYGYLDVVKYLNENRSEGCSELAIHFAAGNGHLDVVKYLHSQGKQCTKDAVDEAARNGHLEIVKFLINNSSEGCSVKAIDFAANNGHVAIVEFLLNNESVSVDFTKEAIKGAALDGDIKLFQLLQSRKSHSNEDLTLALDASLHSGNLELVKLLTSLVFEENQVKITDVQTRGVIKKGHLDVLKYLLEKKCNNVESNWFAIAVVRGHLDICKYLIENHSDLFKKYIDSDPKSLECAIESGNEACVLYYLDQLDDLSILNVDKLTQAAKFKGMVSIVDLLKCKSFKKQKVQ